MSDPQSPGLHHDRGDHRIEFIFLFYFSVTQLAAAVLDSIDGNVKKGKNNTQIAQNITGKFI